MQSTASMQSLQSVTTSSADVIVTGTPRRRRVFSRDGLTSRSAKHPLWPDPEQHLVVHVLYRVRTVRQERHISCILSLCRRACSRGVLDQDDEEDPAQSS